MRPVRFAVVGLGGFASAHHGQIRKLEESGAAKLVAVAEMALDRYPEQAENCRLRGARIYEDAQEMFAKESDRADIVTLPIGIALHAPLAIAAMEAGYDVLTEKPPAATVQDVDAMIAASRKAGRFCAVGFQYMSSPLVRRLKSLLVQGRLGKVQELAIHACWPRGDRYYARNPWAGRSRVKGQWVLDGPMNNALAHQMQNLVFLAGDRRETSARIARVRGEIYRARDISGEDTSTTLAETDSGARIFLGVTHACSERTGPILRVKGSEGEAEGGIDGPVTVRLNGGETLELSGGETTPMECGFRNVVDYFRGDAPALNCPIDITRPMTLVMNASHESSRCIRTIPESAKREVEIGYKNEPDNGYEVEGLPDALEAGFRSMQTLSDLQIPWAEATDWFETGDYDCFTGAELPAGD